jgi:hypothetical protein
MEQIDAKKYTKVDGLVREIEKKLYEKGVWIDNGPGSHAWNAFNKFHWLPGQALWGTKMTQFPDVAMRTGEEILSIASEILKKPE